MSNKNPLRDYARLRGPQIVFGKLAIPAAIAATTMLAACDTIKISIPQLDEARPAGVAPAETGGNPVSIVGKGEKTESVASGKSDKAGGTASANIDPLNCEGLAPSINVIGARSILTYEDPDRSVFNDSMVIPVEARDLVPGCFDLRIFVDGTVPAHQGRDWTDSFFRRKERVRELVKGGKAQTECQALQNASKSPALVDALSKPSDTIGIRLDPRYLRRLKSNDRISVHILLRDHPCRVVNNQIPPEKRVLRYAVKRFTLYETEYYRQKVLASQIPMHEVEAFPLPEEESRALFGPAISKNFFAVRLSLSNSNDFDKLINTGLIVVRGRAIVEPYPETIDPDLRKRIRENLQEANGDTVEDDDARVVRNFRYTVPVAVTPQSDKHMYTLLDDRQPYSGRNWWFRGLDFAGGLATAIVNAIPAGPAAIRGVGVFTGTLTPGLARTFPDRYIAYKRNMVAYALPELVKIPRRGQVGHRYLFFSKNKIEGLILDQSKFGSFEARNSHRLSGSLIPNFVGDQRSTDSEVPKPPKIAVVRLEFDQLEIPFERVLGNQEGSVRDKLATLDVELKRKINETERIAAAWTGDVDASTEARLVGALSGVQWKEAVDRGAAAKTVMDEVFTGGDPTVNLEVLKKIRGHVDNYIKVVNSLSTKRVGNDFLRNKSYGLEALRLASAERDRLATEVVSGRDPDLLATDVEAIEKRIQSWTKRVTFYQQAAREVRSDAFFKHRDQENFITSLKKAGLVDKKNADALAGMEKEMTASIRRLQEAAKGLVNSPLPSLVVAKKQTAAKAKGTGSNNSNATQ